MAWHGVEVVVVVVGGGGGGGGGGVSIDWGLFLAKGILLAPTTSTMDDSFPVL